MASAYKDNNFVPTLIAVLNTDGKTIGRVLANPTDHGLLVSDGTTGSDNGPNHALHDSNMITTMLAVSSADGKTPVPLYVDSAGELLIKST